MDGRKTEGRTGVAFLSAGGPSGPLQKPATVPKEQRFCVITGSILVLVGLLLYLPPWERLSFRLSQSRGQFAGRTVSIPLTSREPRVRVRVWFRAPGGCVLRLASGGPRDYLFAGNRGNWEGHLPSGDTLEFQTQSQEGWYEVRLGPDWHPLGRRFRGLLSIGVLGAALPLLVVGLIGGARECLRSLLSGVPPGRILWALGCLLLAGVFYSAVHELGHYLAGSFFGGEVTEVVWTMFSGQEPHVSFLPGTLTDASSGWMSGAGYLLPTAISTLLLLTAWLMRRGLGFKSLCVLVMPAVALLFGNFGSPFEYWSYLVDGYHPVHAVRLGLTLGLAGPGLAAFCLLPPAASLGLF